MLLYVVTVDIIIDDDDDDPWIGDPTMINISGFQPVVCYIAL